MSNAPLSIAPLSIAIVCYPGVGGSGIVATEIGKAMAARGHRVHFVCDGVPTRLNGAGAAIRFHAVEALDYPLFRHRPYTLALASKLVEVAGWEPLDVVHVHYAVPHATSAMLARQMLGERAPKIITTLHGTDITLVGKDPGYLPITRFSIEASDAITTPSEYLKQATREQLGLSPEVPIEVIPNFVDTERWAPPRPAFRVDEAPESASEWCPFGGDKPIPMLVHVSNFRPVKRVRDVVEVFRRVVAQRPARLVLIGDGPDRSAVERYVHALGLEREVCFLGRRDRFVDTLRHCAVFILTSENESFGLAALEALSCGVPVVAPRVGGVPEVVRHGETGFLVDPGDIDAMASHVVELLDAPARRNQLAARAREDVVERFRLDAMIDRYEALYRRTIQPQGELAKG